ncbi:hypothetical protein DDZ16_16505 [Marinilabilia rubra]|uniref:Uncharacterized protein n=1 Tax=Marinilabilia rubra TaxID=2162893 RepID=A0A2U2B5A9_9BACT|nr:hypothetical protein DDZ16_16505 [Marinilabilia rubra]
MSLSLLRAQYKPEIIGTIQNEIYASAGQYAPGKTIPYKLQDYHSHQQNIAGLLHDYCAFIINYLQLFLNTTIICFVAGLLMARPIFCWWLVEGSLVAIAHFFLLMAQFKPK